MTTTSACSLLMYLPCGDPLGVRTAAIRGRTCRVSAAPPGQAMKMSRFDLKGAAVVLTWHGREVPLISTTPDVDETETTFEHADWDASVAIVSNDQDILPLAVFQVLADVLRTKAGKEAGNAPVEPWFRCLGEAMGESAVTLLSALHVPPFG